ncbi:16S rRNA (guanine1207-N2)-methyltransferase [Marinobacter daqiaonensis]|uniref:16S rRNA (Guanine1207-N2)-methyltransferase n=1 Tax=Marinobacter daqiaonensis TaxID=650891 RepID=A0A1I6H5B5_9GAMM|nr:methyltransferase [Marinobacter daqiaonensis]SFR49594.1 16S rRNA (guanine1207-N2)-methyltransferase [Marinobacter daqiaonensis]
MSLRQGGPHLFPLPGGNLRLERSIPGGRSLRPWDAADEQLVAEARRRLTRGQRIAIVDDSHGALSLGLADFQPGVIADSAALRDSLAFNAGANGLPVPPCGSWIDELGWPAAGEAPGAPDDRFDAIILKVPRQLDYLEFLLRWSNQVLVPGGIQLTGGMIKHLPAQAARVYQKLVTTDAVLPARKKARCVVCRPGSLTLAGWDQLWRGYRMDSLKASVQALPSVFARERLDIGTRELLPFIPATLADAPAGAQVLDLACGNGVLGLSALMANPGVTVTFTDVSSQAILSVGANVRALGIAADRVALVHEDGVPESAGRFDRILLNPPFHEGGVVGDHIALRLFDEAASHLAPGGRLLMVGNRHLGYHRSLKTAFGNVRQLAASPRFVVFEASEPR